MVECCWRGALFYLLTARLSGFRTTPHGDMQGAAAASSSPRGRMSLPGLICWYFPVNCCHVAFPQKTSHIPPFALARRRDLSVMAWIAHQEMRRAKAVEYLSLVSSNLICILPFGQKTRAAEMTGWRCFPNVHARLAPRWSAVSVDCFRS